MTDFQEKLEALLDQHVKDLSCEEHGVIPVISDYVIVVAIDDGANPGGGGMYVGAKASTPLYRTMGLFHEAMDLVRRKGSEHGE